MSNSLRMDFSRLFMLKIYNMFAIGVSVVGPVLVNIILWAVGKMMGVPLVCNMDNFLNYSRTSALYIAIAATFFLYTEINEGILRNKIVSGKKRTEILLSYSFTMVVYAVILQVAAELSTLVSMAALGAKFILPSWTIVFEMIGIHAAAGVAIAIFFTVLYCVFCTTRAAMILPALVAVCSRIGLIYVLDKLYPESGVCTLTGAKLAVFTFIDRFIPFSYLVTVPHWDLKNYALGCGSMIALSLLIGIPVFKRIDVK